MVVSVTARHTCNQTSLAVQQPIKFCETCPAKTEPNKLGFWTTIKSAVQCIVLRDLVRQFQTDDPVTPNVPLPNMACILGSL